MGPGLFPVVLKILVLTNGDVRSNEVVRWSARNARRREFASHWSHVPGFVNPERRIICGFVQWTRQSFVGGFVNSKEAGPSGRLYRQ